MGWVLSCQLCGDGELVMLLDMGSQPVAERFDGDPALFPLPLMQCAACGLVQLGYQVDPHVLFPPEHPYTTGNTAALREHYARLAARLSPHLNPGGDLIVEIGANDGTLLRAFGSAFRRIAVEPTRQGHKCGTGILVYQKFFTAKVAEDIVGTHGRARLVLANNVLAHVPDVHDTARGIANLLTSDGFLVAENHDVRQVLNGQWDTVYHEHLRYWSPGTFARLLETHGMHVTKITSVGTHGGSFRTVAVRARDRLTQAPVIRQRLYQMLLDATAAGGSVYGMGATTRAVPLITYTGIAPFITAVGEVTGSEKIGRRMPGTAIPVIDEKEMLAARPTHILLLAWHLAGDLVPKLRAAGYQGRVITPLPEPRED